uniref:Peptidase C14 caspase domain-containing protein n=1 Tax=Anopheles atroparvus TaxID=41427 RepID=A0AAG5DIZ0_ANOAO
MDSVRRRDFSHCSCLIVIILGQSGKKNCIQTQDAEYSIRNDIIEHVTAIKTLVGKPKMFVVCVTQKDAVDTDSPQVQGSNKVDTVMFESALEEPSSSGSFFLSTFFEVLRENDTRNMDEISMLISKRAKDQGQPQAPSMIATLRKRLIFADLRK